MKKLTGKAIQIIEFLYGEDKEKIWDIAEHKEKRSLNANAFFHVLCDKIRQAQRLSMARVKNQLIADYGQVQYLADGEPLIYKTNAPEEYMQELEFIHTKCVKVSTENDKLVYFYRVYRGSHTYNTEEMAKLIEGTVQEARQLDIETATPDEIKRMIDAYKN